ncbi:hypothetical protein ALC53_05736 [Atta colombica]|uniref:Uncharacterized protein n=1 Tax=Atta colombica TaxID=520822 RepID=A0A195BGS6_9HYME|nr:hypothetical protein ALC53_05736 [Atta colombica]
MKHDDGEGGVERGGQHRVGGLDVEELVDKREYKLKRRLRSQILRHMVTFVIIVRSPEVVIRSAIIPPSKYSRHESSIRDVEIACGIRGNKFHHRDTPRLYLNKLSIAVLGTDYYQSTRRYMNGCDIVKPHTACAEACASTLFMKRQSVKTEGRNKSPSANSGCHYTRSSGVAAASCVDPDAAFHRERMACHVHIITKSGHRFIGVRPLAVPTNRSVVVALCARGLNVTLKRLRMILRSGSVTFPCTSLPAGDPATSIPTISLSRKCYYSARSELRLRAYCLKMIHMIEKLFEFVV